MLIIVAMLKLIQLCEIKEFASIIIEFSDAIRTAGGVHSAHLR